MFDADAFAARWVSHGIGRLRLLHLLAPAQRVTHTGAEGSSGRAAPSIQLVYSISGVMRTRMGGKTFDVAPGEFVLLDNTRFYEMEMASEHECIDLMMPRGWLEKHLPDPGSLLANPVGTREGWGAPLGALLRTMAHRLEEAPLPRPMIAEQVGSLLALATGLPEPAEGSRHRAELARRILGRIESDHADPDLSPALVARECGISMRSLQAVLAASGTSFVQELNATRLDRASEMLADAHAQGLSIADVAFRSGFLDPGYFTRTFRKRFGITPSQWRSGHAPQS